MPTGPMTSMGNSVMRWMARMFRTEYCTVLEVNKYGEPGIQCHSPDNPKYYNTVTVKIRDARKYADPLELERQYEAVLQDFVGNCFGHPWTPRVGDLVQVLFMYNAQPLVLGPVYTTYQAPPMRAPTSADAMYDEVWKWCQWLEPEQDQNHDYKNHPQGKEPICRKLFHGPITGEEGKGRDQQFCWDCKKGDADPTCSECETIDSVPRSGEQWFKQYSSETESEEAYNSRAEWHSRCGSFSRWESACENDAGTSSAEYSEKTGHIRMGNAVEETDQRGHINFRGSEGCSGGGKAGTIDIHSAFEEVAYESEHVGARTSVVAPEDTSVSWACESIDFTAPISFMRVYKKGGQMDGCVEINSHNNASYMLVDGANRTAFIDGTNLIYEYADVSIEEVTPLVHMTGDCVIDGNLTHGSCSCPCGGGSGGSPGAGSMADVAAAVMAIQATQATEACASTASESACTSDGSVCTSGGSTCSSGSCGSASMDAATDSCCSIDGEIVFSDSCSLTSGDISASDAAALDAASCCWENEPVISDGDWLGCI